MSERNPCPNIPLVSALRRRHDGIADGPQHCCAFVSAHLQGIFCFGGGGVQFRHESSKPEFFISVDGNVASACPDVENIAYGFVPRGLQAGTLGSHLVAI